MTLLETQRAVLAELSGDGDAPASSPGMAVYQNGYRTRLVETLGVSFPRTKRWVGEDAFTAAAIDHVIRHPPANWTLDVYGAGFPETLAGLFGDDPEVAELAWLEWAMDQAFAAPDEPALDPAALATLTGAAFDWEAARFGFVRTLTIRWVTTACDSLWAALDDQQVEPPTAIVLPVRQPLIVWRQGLVPRLRMLDAPEYSALTALRNGRTFGELCADCARQSDEAQAAERAGGLLGRWLGDDLIAELR